MNGGESWLVISGDDDDDDGDGGDDDDDGDDDDGDDDGDGDDDDDDDDDVLFLLGHHYELAHRLPKDCLLEWLARKMRCPLCRMDLHWAYHSQARIMRR